MLFSIYNEFGISFYGNDGSVYCSEKFFYDYLDMFLSRVLEEDILVKIKF